MTPPIRMVSAPVEDLIDIVEGIGGIQHGTWRDEQGHRLKDTPAWAAFYVAARNAAAPVREEGGVVSEAVKIATDLHHAYEKLIYGLPKYLEAENLTDEENMIRKAWITLDVTAHRLAALATREEAPVEAGEDDGMFLLMKRDLYYRPNAMGYTGIKDNAGRYTEAEAASHADEASGVTAIRASDAPDFSPACFDDLARQHLEKKLDDARREIAALRAQPQAREEAQPVGYAHASALEGGYGHMTLFEDNMPRLHDLPLYTTPPAPEAEKLRVAIREEIKLWADTRWPKSHGIGSKGWVDGLTNRVLAALRQEGR